jgi:hypothetical protein
MVRRGNKRLVAITLCFRSYSTRTKPTRCPFSRVQVVRLDKDRVLDRRDHDLRDPHAALNDERLGSQIYKNNQ